jgi:hypothetical protein
MKRMFFVFTNQKCFTGPGLNKEVTPAEKDRLERIA